MKLSYITVLSNWLLGYQKYSKTYSKENLEKSTYPNEFYLLKQDEFEIGLNKARKLIKKIDSENNAISSNNKIIRIETNFVDSLVKKNDRNGLGWVVYQNWIPVHNVYIYKENEWIKTSIEELTAMSYQLNDKNFIPYNKLKPRSLSILPVAKACQASCKFCFSESSISFDQKRNVVDIENLKKICIEAKNKGAERFVITGGGEPTLIKYETLLETIKTASKYFNKIVLISNGLFLSEENEEIAISKVNKLIDAGLTVLSLSYHHYDKDKNTNIMGKEINTNWLLEIFNKNKIHEKITLRLICVLQKEGVNNYNEIHNYIKYAIDKNIHQVCFKELYVSSTEESMYAGQKENKYSEDNQIPLSILISYLDEKAIKITELPWGSPVYSYQNIIDIAAYTEPSVGWERANGIARSWNIMADGKCFASLEDKNSIVEINR